MHSKQDEIAILTECANKLGPDSYCGPWLHERIAELQSLIRSDIFPTISLGDAELRCAEIIEAAEERAQLIKQNAQDAANNDQRLRQRATQQASDAVRQALRTLENL